MKRSQTMHIKEPKQQRFGKHKGTGTHKAAHPTAPGNVGSGNCANSAKRK